jgi:hypothetical protein
MFMPIPTLEECLGVENLCKLKDQEENDMKGLYKLYGSSAEQALGQGISVSLDIVAEGRDEFVLGDRETSVNLQGQHEQGEAETNIDTSQRSDGMKLGAPIA